MRDRRVRRARHVLTADASVPRRATPPWLGGGQHTPATTASHEAPPSADAEVNSPLGGFAWGDEGDDDSGDDSEEGRRYADELRRADGFASAEEDEEDGDADDDGDDPQRAERQWDY